MDDRVINTSTNRGYWLLVGPLVSYTSLLLFRCSFVSLTIHRELMDDVYIYIYITILTTLLDYHLL
jgi:hypothetical protein